MIKWYIDKNDKKPLYLQLKDLIIYYTNTGDIQDKQSLPGIRHLSKELGITYETVRKALKELESEGIISMGRGKSSTITLYKKIEKKSQVKVPLAQESIKYFKDTVKELSRAGLSLEEIKKIVDYSYHEAMTEGLHRFFIFAECNNYQIEEISKILSENLGIEVKPFLVQDVKLETLQKASDEEGKLLGIITTTFHINEIRQAIGNMPIYLDTLHIRMSPETKEKIKAYIKKKARIGLICLNSVMSYYNVMARVELGTEVDITFCPYEEKSKVATLLKSLDVLILSPAVFEDIKKVAPPELAIFNFMDQIDPLSLSIIKTRVSELT